MTDTVTKIGLSFCVVALCLLAAFNLGRYEAGKAAHLCHGGKQFARVLD